MFYVLQITKKKVIVFYFGRVFKLTFDKKDDKK